MSRYFSHIYIVLGERVDDEEWIVRVWYKPFISLIWIGAIITASKQSKKFMYLVL